MFTFATDYFLFVFVATIGVIQIGAASGRLTGLLLLPSPGSARAVGALVAIVSFIWFFATGERNINDYGGGLDAPTQALFFFLGILAGGGFTAVVSSLVNWRIRGVAEPEEGFGALRHVSYLVALRNSLEHWWKNWRTRTKQYFSG